MLVLSVMFNERYEAELCVDRHCDNGRSTAMASLSALKPSASEEDLVHGGVAMSNPVNVQKFPIRRLKPAILKFQKVLQIDLDRLEKHRNNIDKVGYGNDKCVCTYV